MKHFTTQVTFFLTFCQVAYLVKKKGKIHLNHKKHTDPDICLNFDELWCEILLNINEPDTMDICLIKFIDFLQRIVHLVMVLIYKHLNPFTSTENFESLGIFSTEVIWVHLSFCLHLSSILRPFLVLTLIILHHKVTIFQNNIIWYWVNYFIE